MLSPSSDFVNLSKIPSIGKSKVRSNTAKTASHKDNKTLNVCGSYSKRAI